MNLSLNVVTFQFWAQFNPYVMLVSLTQILCAVYGYFLATSETGSERLKVLYQIYVVVFAVLGFSALIVPPLVLLGVCGWRMADHVGLLTISENLIWICLVEVVPFAFLIPGILGC